MPTVKRAWTVFGLGCLGLLLMPDGRATARPPTPHGAISLREIRCRHEQFRAILHSLQVEGTLTSRRRQAGQWITQRLRVTFAAAGDKRYLDVIHLTDGAGEDLDERRNQQYLAGDEWQLFFPLQRRCERLRGPKVRIHARFARANFFMECLGWWPPSDETPPPTNADRLFILHEALTASGYRLLEEPESIDGVQCHIVEYPNMEKMWFDPEKNFALRRRELYLEQGGALAVRYDLCDYKETISGIWFPLTLQRTIYEPRRVPPGALPPVETVTLGQVNQVIINKVPENRFLFHPPPGTLIWDRDSDKNWQTPGGLSLLDEVIEAVNARNARRAALGASRPSRRIAHDTDQYMLGASILFLIALDGYLFYRGLRRT